MYVELDAVDLKEFSAIIIGSGPGGTAAGEVVAKAGKKVLILEAGAEGFPQKLQDIVTDMEGIGHFDGDYWPRHWAIGLGGTSSRWSGWCIKLDKRDYEKWPISAATVEPYYKKAIEFTGTPEIALGYERPSVRDFVFKPISRKPALRLASSFYGQDLPENFYVSKNSCVKKILYTSNGKSVSKLVVRFGDKDMSLDISPKQTVIVAAGGIGNAQILLQPDENGEQTLKNRLPKLGAYLSEHPHIYDAGQVAMIDQLELSVPETYGPHVAALSPVDSVYEKCGKLGFSLQLLRFVGPNKVPNLGYINSRSASMYNYRVRAEMTPSENNRVELGSLNEYGMYRPVAFCAISSDDLFNYHKYLRILGYNLRKDKKGLLSIDNEILFRTPTGGGHTMGTTRMSAKPADGVVDTNCFVHGVSNLAVAGSSVFTSCGAANPTLTIVALAKRLGEKIAGV